MRIAMIGTRGLPATHGGVERAVEALSRHLAGRGHEVTVYGRRGYCDPALEMAEQVRQVCLPTISTKHLEAVTHTALATTHAITTNRFDVLHFHATGPALFAAAARMRPGLPTVATVQGLDWKREKWGRGARGVLKLGARAAATIPTETIVVSRELRRLLSEAYGAETTFIPNGVDFDEIELTPEPVEDLEPNQFVLFLGRLVPEKQVHVLVDAFRRLETDLKLVIAGTALHAEDYLADVRRRIGEDPRIVLAGPRYGAQKAWLLNNARVFVQPSTIEGMPIALLEALASGTDAVVSDIPENIETVTIGGVSFGHPFRTGSVDDLARALRIFLESDEKLLPDARSLTRAVYDWGRITEETEMVYERVIARSP